MNYAADSKVDRVFFLGDFGWKFSEDFLSTASKLYTDTGLYVDFIDGNHEDFHFLYSHPVASDGYRYLADGVRHIPRGTVLDLDGAKVLCMGGATSIDRLWRVPNITWWAEEEITDRDMFTAVQNLLAVGGQVDAVFAHDGPVLPDQSNKNTAELLEMSPGLAYDLALSDANRAKLAALMNIAMPRRWFHGHHHTRFTSVVDTWYGACTVECLDMDGTKVPRAMLIVHTDDWTVDSANDHHFSWTDEKGTYGNA